MWYKNYYTWFLTWGLTASSLVVPVLARYGLTGKTSKRAVSEDYFFFHQRDKKFAPNGDANLFTGLDFVK